ncbi:MAG: TonB-dependent receptor [Gammaproteobacteria bacterium]
MNRVRVRHIPLLSLATAITAVTSTAALAQPAGVEEVVVFGRSTNLVGQAASATEGSISGADLLIRPMFKTAELLESMPGMVAVQHSGSGKANQYFLRGFNLDHGTDYTTLLDGIPLNMRSHGHGQGYLDVNGLIPETVNNIDYRKGPYRADLGDFAMVGASFISTIDRLEQSFVSGETGRFGWRRMAGGISEEVGGGVLTLVGELKQYDGAWQKPEELDHKSLWAKYLRNTDFGRMQVTLSAYDATWDPTEQVPERAIGSAVCPDAYCSLDPTAQGSTERWILATQLEGSYWNAALYLQHYDWFMNSNPTYDYQLEQFDERWIGGGNIAATVIDNDALQVDIGANFRYDDADRVGVHHTDRRAFVENIADNALTEASVGVYTEATWQLTDQLRLMGGLRFDRYGFDVDALNPATSVEGEESDRIASPKAGLAYALNRSVELYANWGRGFHSNDARGVVNVRDPVAGLSRGTGYEGGARFAFGDVKFTAAYWWLDQDSELIFVGDSNAVEPKGGSERDGYELTMFWQPVTWLGIDATYAHSNAHYVNNPDGRYVENALEDSGQLGITATQQNWDASLRVRYLGNYPMVADNSQRADSLTTVNLRGAYHWNALTLYAEFINALDTDGKEIQYWYEAYVNGVDPAGQTSDDIDCSVTNCTLSRATEPRAFRVGLSYKF